MSIGWGHARTYARACMYIGGLHVNWVGPCKDMCMYMYIGGLHVNWVGPCEDICMYMYIGGLHVNWVGPCEDICTYMYVHRWTACQLGGAVQGHMHVHVCT